MSAFTGMIDKIRAEVATTSTVHQAADRWGELTDDYEDAPEGSAERRRVGALIADCVEEIADGIEASKLASWVGFIGTPASLRRDAVQWRSGEMYVGP